MREWVAPDMATFHSQFNERLYEFAVNFELVATMGAFIAGYIPGVPSPQDEAELGWDAAVPLPAIGQLLLLQYKVASRTTARAGANAKFWDVYGAEYYRFRLHRDARGLYTQHQLLLDAAITGVTPLYCAPVLRTRGELVGALRQRALLDSSALIPVSSLGAAVGTDAHSVTYPANPTDGAPTLHSDPTRGIRMAADDLRTGTATQSRALDEATFENFAATASEYSVERRGRRRRRDRVVRAHDPRADAYLHASAIASDELGATLVIVAG